MDDPDYSWAYQVPISGDPARSAEEWARGVFEGPPRAVRIALLAGWKFGLGLRIRASSGNVLGWRIHSAEQHAITLHAESRIVRAENVVLVDEATVTWVTRVRYRNRLGRAAWTAASPIHHCVLPLLLTRASRELTGA